MSEIREKIERLSIKVSSPDGLVWGTSTRSQGTRIDLDPEVFDEHDEESFAEQIEEVLSGIVVGHREAADLIRADVRGNPDPPPDDSPFARRQAQLAETIRDLTTQVKSPRGYISIEWYNDSEFAVVLKSRTLDVLDVPRLSSELNSAVFALLGLRRKQTMKLYQEAYGHDRFAKQKR